MHAQQRLYSDLKEKLAEDYDTKIQLLKSDMQNDMDAKISFLKMATEDKTSEESRLKKQLVGKEKEFFQLQTSYDLLEASSNSSARVAAEQVNEFPTMLPITSSIISAQVIICHDLIILLQCARSTDCVSEQKLAKENSSA